MNTPKVRARVIAVKDLAQEFPKELKEEPYSPYNLPIKEMRKLNQRVIP